MRVFLPFLSRISTTATVVVISIVLPPFYFEARPTEIEFRECVNFPPRAASSLPLAACPLFGGCVVLASSLQKIDNILLLCFGYGRWSFVPGTSFEGGFGQMNSGFFTSFCWGVFPSFRFPYNPF